MDKIVQWFTVGRAIALALMMAVGGVGTGIGFLLGEGSARASFAALYQDHERRLVLVEVHAREATTQNTRILEVLGEVKGELRAVRETLRRNP